MMEKATPYEIITHLLHWLYNHYVAPVVFKSIKLFRKDEDLSGLESRIYNLMNYDHYFK